MKTTPSMEPPESPIRQDIAVALRDQQTIVGYGRRQHGLNGKDADLDYGGQCVVKEIQVVDGTSKDTTLFLVIKIVRYANICEPEEERLRSIAEEIVMCADEYEGEWTGSDYWTFRHLETVRVPLTVDEYEAGTTDGNISLLAGKCVSAIQSASGVAFEKWATELAQQIESLRDTQKSS